jgi:hypothetical protein
MADSPNSPPIDRAATFAKFSSSIEDKLLELKQDAAARDPREMLVTFAAEVDMNFAALTQTLTALPRPPMLDQLAPHFEALHKGIEDLATAQAVKTFETDAPSIAGSSDAAVDEIKHMMESTRQEIRQLLADQYATQQAYGTGTFTTPSLKRTAGFLALSAVTGIVVTLAVLATVPGSVSQQIVRETPQQLWGRTILEPARTSGMECVTQAILKGATATCQIRVNVKPAP